ncbi:MAG: ABC transporter permease, partial [Rhizobiaceae bacterium]|nr:ABC transporter permease [Rhizobiaceae bacterium]
MTSLIAIRLRNAAVMLVLATLLCFALVVSAPGNVAVLVAELRTPKATFEQIHKVEEELGLNKPLIVRYGLWLKGALEGNLGVSYKTGQNIGESLAGRLPITLTLILGGAT